MPVTKLSISLPPDLVAALDERGDERSGTLARHVARYLAILDGSRRRLAGLLSDSEIGLILDVLNGTRFADTISITMVHAEVEDSLEDGYAEKWECDGPALVTKLRALSYADSAALVDAVERWWNRVAAGESKLKPGEALKAPKRGK